MYMGNKNGRYLNNNEIENASSYLNLKNSSKSYFSACFEYNIYDKVITINIARFQGILMAKSFLCLNLTKLYTQNQIKEVLFHTSWNISSYVYPIHEEILLEFLCKCQQQSPWCIPLRTFY